MLRVSIVCALLAVSAPASADSDSTCSFGKVPVGDGNTCCYPGETYHPEGTPEAPAHTCWGEPQCPEGYERFPWTDPHTGNTVYTCTGTPSADPAYTDPYADPYVDPYAAAPPPPPRSRVGHMPYFELAGAIAVAMNVHDPEFPDYEYNSETGFGGVLDLHLELGDKALVTATGFLGGGGVHWMGRGNVVLGTKLGKRTTHNVWQLTGRQQTSTHTIETYESYGDRQLPLYLGLLAGASLIETAGGRATMIEVGAAAISPQMHFLLAPSYSVAKGGIGFRFAFGYAPGLIARMPLFFRFNGDLGGGDAFGTLFTISLGLGSPVGV